VTEPVNRLGAGYRPPPPTTAARVVNPNITPRAPTVTRNQVDGTAGSVDPLAEYNATLEIGARTQFRTVEFDRALLQHGKRVVWRKAMLCPCQQEATDQANPACVSCDGSGFFYVDPLEILAHMAAFSKSTRLYEKFGLWTSGEVSVTTQQAYRLAWQDSIEMIDDMMNFNELLKKGNRRGRRSALPALTDSARYRIAKLTKALYLDPTGQVLPLEVGYHMTLNAQGHIVWLAAGERLVCDGQLVSIHYDFHPCWIVTSHPHASRTDVAGVHQATADVVGLPLQCSAQLDFLAQTERILPVTGPA